MQSYKSHQTTLVLPKKAADQEIKKKLGKFVEEAFELVGKLN